MSVPATTEQVALALFNLLVGAVNAVVPIVDKDRRIKDLTQVDRAMMPALYVEQLVQMHQVQQPRPGILRERKLHFSVVAYVAEDQVAGSLSITPLNAIYDAIDGAIYPPNQVNALQTLGGIVNDCRIDGTVIFAQPIDNDGKAGLLVPIVVIRP